METATAVPIQVFFNEPVEGVDADEGSLVLRREVRATAVRQENGRTQFVDGSGTVVAAWDSRIVEEIDWPDGVCLVPSTPARWWGA